MIKPITALPRNKSVFPNIFITFHTRDNNVVAVKAIPIAKRAPFSPSAVSRSNKNATKGIATDRNKTKNID